MRYATAAVLTHARVQVDTGELMFDDEEQNQDQPKPSPARLKFSYWIARLGLQVNWTTADGFFYGPAALCNDTVDVRERNTIRNFNVQSGVETTARK